MHRGAHSSFMIKLRSTQFFTLFVILTHFPARIFFFPTTRIRIVIINIHIHLHTFIYIFITFTWVKCVRKYFSLDIFWNISSCNEWKYEKTDLYSADFFAKYFFFFSTRTYTYNDVIMQQTIVKRARWIITPQANCNRLINLGIVEWTNGYSQMNWAYTLWVKYEWDIYICIYIYVRVYIYVL